MTKTVEHDPQLFTPEQPSAKPPATRQKRGASTDVAVAAPRTVPLTIMEMIGEAAANPAVNPEKMRELIAIKRDLEREEAEAEFDEALASAQAELPIVVRNARNTHTNSRYATLEKVQKSIDPVLKKYHFVLSFGMSDSPLGDHYRITAQLSRKGPITGRTHKRDYFIDLPSDNKGAKGGDTKTAVHGIGSTISYGRRYLTLLIFNITVANEDDDGNGGQMPTLITEEQADELLKLCAEKNIGLSMFKTAFGVEEISGLPANRFIEAKNRLKKAPKQEPKTNDGVDHADE